MHDFILRQNADRFRNRLTETQDPGERNRLRVMLSTVERELALFESQAAGARARPLPIGAQAQLEASRNHLIADFRRRFEDHPQIAYLIDPAPGLCFVAINAAFEQATELPRSEVEGRPLFTLFPDNPDDPNADGAWQIYGSMRKVAETLQPDAMPVMRYDVRDADGTFVERYWRHMNTPVFNADGRLIFLQHVVDEVTDDVRAGRVPASDA